MKKISSITTNFRRRILPIILFLNFVIILGCFLDFYKFRFNNFLLFSTILFFLVWFFVFRKLKTVYMSQSHLKFDSQQVNFENVISIIKIRSFSYCVTYKVNNKIDKIEFMVDSLPFITPKFIKELRNKINKN